MRRYTYRDRQKSIATRRRNARLRRQNNTATTGNQKKTTVNLSEGLIVTKGVEKRLSNKAKSETPFRSSIAGALVFIWVLTFVLISRSSTDISQSGWIFLFLLPAFVLSILLIYSWRATVKTRVVQLGGERKKRLDETEQFYSSPEWNLLRNQVIREEGSVCHICGKRIQNKNDITVDHIRPRSKYPALALDRQNLHVLCRRCNSSKGANDLLDA